MSVTALLLVPDQDCSNCALPSLLLGRTSLGPLCPSCYYSLSQPPPARPTVAEIEAAERLWAGRK